jgi:C4-dicarboxylate-specific signal transduction histidine kinase
LANNLDKIGQQALRAGDIIRHLRSFVRRRGIDPAPLDLNEVVRSARDLMEPRARKSGIRLELRLDPSPPLVIGVSVQVEQVLLNLLRNAFDAIDDAGMQGGTVTVTTRRSGDKVRVTVRDNGPGIDAEAAARLFEPLSSRKVDGLGVGLRISRSLIEAHGGRLWVEPQVPGGVLHFKLSLAP